MITRRKFIPAAAGVVALGSLGRLGTSAAQDASPVVANIDELPLRKAGQLTVHTDQPLYAPWYIDNDPANGQGFESALVYNVAERMGFTADQVDWGYTAFNASYAPGPKDFDIYVTEVSITEARKEAVSFSDPYYFSPLVLLAVDDSDVFEAQTMEDLKKFKFGTQVGTVFATYISDVIQPEQQPLIFNSNPESIQALSNGQVDAILETLQIGQAIVTFQFDNLGLVALLPDGGSDLGMVFEKDSPLVPYVNTAIQSLKDDGTLDALIDEWLPIPEDLRVISQ